MTDKNLPEDSQKQLDTLLKNNEKIDILLEQTQKMLFMVLDLSVKVTAMEKILYENNIVKPGDFQEIVNNIANEMGSNIQKKMEELASANKE